MNSQIGGMRHISHKGILHGCSVPLQFGMYQRHLVVHRCSQLAARAKLPSRGYFSEADPNAEVYAKSGKKFDPKKKPGRFDPEFIWQSNWQEALELEEQAKKAQEEYANQETAKPSGFLSLSRVNSLNSMDADLGQQLAQSPTSAAPVASFDLPNMSSKRGYAKPTQGESRIWKRNTRLSERAFAVEPTAEEAVQKKEEQLKADRERYEQLKQEFQLWSFSLAAFTFAVTYAFYTRDIAVSYLLGAVGGLVYLRLLNKQVDGIGGGGGLGAAVGPPRLLVPVILVLGYNRWNELAVEPTGIHLDLLPMLLGFFTYKGAVIARQGLQLLSDITDQNSESLQQSTLPDDDKQGKASKDVPSIDDIMVKNILSR